jgi:predicted metal-dependent hydrolase
MPMQELTISGLPDGVVVRSSSRRRKTITAFRENGQTVVVVPARMSSTSIRSAVIDLMQRLDDKQRRRTVTDEQLHARAESLRRVYLPEAPPPLQVQWSTRQRRRWGSCTPTDRTIRLSTMLQGMPDYVIDSVLIHELAHLLHAGHGRAFRSLLERFPDNARATAYLEGFAYARELAATELADGDEHPYAPVPLPRTRNG